MSAPIAGTTDAAREQARIEAARPHANPWRFAALTGAFRMFHLPRRRSYASRGVSRMREDRDAYNAAEPGAPHAHPRTGLRCGTDREICQFLRLPRHPDRDRPSRKFLP